MVRKLRKQELNAERMILNGVGISRLFHYVGQGQSFYINTWLPADLYTYSSNTLYWTAGRVLDFLRENPEMIGIPEEKNDKGLPKPPYVDPDEPLLQLL